MQFLGFKLKIGIRDGKRESASDSENRESVAVLYRLYRRKREGNTKAISSFVLSQCFEVIRL